MYLLRLILIAAIFAVSCAGIVAGPPAHDPMILSEAQAGHGDHGHSHDEPEAEAPSGHAHGHDPGDHMHETFGDAVAVRFIPGSEGDIARSPFAPVSKPAASFPADRPPRPLIVA